MNNTVWTPNRQSNAARAFLATLRLRFSGWDWADSPDLTRCWVVDSTGGADTPALLSIYDRMPSKPKVAFLSLHPESSLPRPAWTFFRIPVKGSLIFEWVEQHGLDEWRHQPAAAGDADMPWRHGLLRLKQWPNPARYGNTLEFTVACSRLLAQPATYAQVLQWGIAPTLVDQMLKDAHREGLLDVSSPPSASPDLALADALIPAAHSAKGGASATEAPQWGLIKRLLKKFSLK